MTATANVSERLSDAIDQLRALGRWLTSHRKRSWTLADYPIKVRSNPIIAELANVPAPKFVAQVVNWWTMSGVGDTPAEALADLARAVEAHRASVGSLPRPGSRVPIEFATSDRIASLWHIAERFLPDVLDIDPSDVFLSDESTLWDFAFGQESVAPLVARTREVFGVDISDIEDGNLVQIFTRLDARDRRV